MKKILKKILFRIFPSQEFKRSGERQVAPEIDKIRKDHVERYKFAAEYIKHNEKVIDAACGVGYGSNLLSEKGAFISAYDLDPRAINYAEKNYGNKNIKFHTGDIEKDINSVETFDAAVSFETIEHLNNPEKFLSAVNTALKGNGKLICSTPNQNVIPFSKDKYPYHRSHYTPGEFEQLLNGSGFIVKEWYSQHDTEEGIIVKDKNGKFLIALTEKQN